MTACVNKNHGRRVAGVVTASLVGALTLGGVSLAAVPTVALAEQGSLQAVGSLDGMTILSAKNGKDDAISVSDGVTELPEKTGQFLVPTELTGSGYDSVKVDLSKFDVKYYAGKDTSGSLVAQLGHDAARYFSNDVHTAEGTYVTVKVAPKSGNADFSGSFTKTFKYVAASSKSYKLVSAADGESTTFTYNGSAQGVKVEHADGTAASNPSPTAYIGADGNPAAGTWATAPTEAGTYTVKFTDDNGNNQYLTYTIDKLDLAKASVAIADANAQYGTDVSSAVAQLPASVKDVVEVSSIKGPKGAEYNAGVGTYTLTLVAKGTKAGTPDGNVTGSLDVSYTVYDKAASFFYGQSDLASTYNSESSALVVDQTVGTKFDASLLVATYSGANYRGDKLEVTYAKKTGVDSHGNSVFKSATADDLQQDGTYKVTVRLVPFTDAKDEVVGGFATLYVKVGAKKLVANDTLTFTLGGKVVSGSASVDYDGSDVLKSLGVEVKDADGKVYVAGTDYKVVAQKNGAGDELDSITEANATGESYTVKVKPITFKWDNDSDAELTLKVNSADVSTLRDYVDGQAFGGASSTYKENSALIYTGSELALPDVQYVTEAGTATKGPKYATLPADAYKVVRLSYTSNDGETKDKTVDALKDAGTYVVYIQTTDKTSPNYDVKDLKFEVQVRKAKSFTDVAADKWYAKPVEEAFQQFYVNGTSGTVLFTPEADITRADAVGILYNMAGGPKVTDDLVTEDQGYYTGFSDVDSHVYYAKALAWAHKVGVANGYADGTFAPNAKITREEFAALLSNYAKATGKYTAATEDKLSGLSDASGVSAWAKDAVNWAVSNKVMGNGGYVAATSNITRAEVAAMAVNYQPKALVSDVNGVKPGERVH